MSFVDPDCFGTFEGRYQRVPALNLIAAPVPISWSPTQIAHFNRYFVIDAEDDDEGGQVSGQQSIGMYALLLVILFLKAFINVIYSSKISTIPMVDDIGTCVYRCCS